MRETSAPRLGYRMILGKGKLDGEFLRRYEGVYSTLEKWKKVWGVSAGADTGYFRKSHAGFCSSTLNTDVEGVLNFLNYNSPFHFGEEGGYSIQVKIERLH